MNIDDWYCKDLVTGKRFHFQYYSTSYPFPKNKYFALINGRNTIIALVEVPDDFDINKYL